MQHYHCTLKKSYLLTIILHNYKKKGDYSMYSKFSNSLLNIKPKLKDLLSHLSHEYKYVSILAQESSGKVYRVSKTGTSITDSVLLAGKGCVIKVYDGSGYAEFSFNNFSQEYLDSIPDIIRKQLIPLDEHVSDLAKKMIYGIPEDKSISFSKSSEFDIDPVSYGDDKIISRLTNIHKAGINYSDKILDCPVSFQYMHSDKIFISPNKDLQQSLVWSTGFIQPIASTGRETHYYYQPFSKLGGAEIINEMMDYIPKSCDSVIQLLDSTSIKPRLYDVICMPDVTGMIAHEAFGHGVEMDMFVKDRALAKSYIGKPVASPLVTMHDQSSDAIEAGSYFFDDEGTLCSDTVIIKNGILEKGINDIQTAMSLNVEPTGNGRRESYERKAYTRMTNTYFEKGDSKLDEMIASIKDGYLLENASCGMEDPKNWGIQCMVNMAREIKDGKLTGRVCSPVVLSGYVPDLLKSISMISDDFHLSGSGCCGKGYKEWVKVSDGGAAIKAQVKLS